MYCSNCGSQIHEKSVICPNCKTILKKEFYHNKYDYAWGVLGFFIPLVGLILYLVWKESNPKIAKITGFGALCGVFAYVLFCIAYFMFGILLFLSIVS